jgi:hypothetical protein
MLRVRLSGGGFKQFAERVLGGNADALRLIRTLGVGTIKSFDCNALRREGSFRWCIGAMSPRQRIAADTNGHDPKIKKPSKSMN